MSDDTFVSFAERLLSNAHAIAQRPAIVCDGAVLTYGALIKKASACAGRLQSLDLEPQGRRRVAIIAANSLDYATIIVACQLAAVPVVPLPCLVGADALARMLDDAEVAVVFYDQDYAEKALTAIHSSRTTTMTAVKIGPSERAGEEHTLLDAWLASQSGRFTPPTIEPDWESDLIYSSGTTGLPKGITQTHRGRVRQSIGLAQLGIGNGVSVFHTVGQYSNFGMIAIFLALWWHGTFYLTRKFSGAGLRDTLLEKRIDLTFVVPATLMRALETPGFDAVAQRAPCIKLSSGAPLSKALKQQTLAHWPGPLFDAYGQTETGALTMLRADSVADDKLGSVGTPLPTTVLRILDDAGNPLPVGAEGEIAAHTPTLMSGYHGHEEATEAVHWRDEQGRLYIRTGDIGRLDQDGYLWLCDRKKDLIISGGFNIYPADIERELEAHPAVLEAAVVGAPSARWGETPVAFVTLRDSHRVDAQELQSWVNARVGSVQRVAAIRILQELPRGALGKILKRELRQYVAEMIGSLP
ncbi:MAG TPA: class I adenylate-forming enzyme family protein [Steroidobacter sp.]